jgi:hypothetical protein
MSKPLVPPGICPVRGHHWHEFGGSHADVTHLQGEVEETRKYRRPEPARRRRYQGFQPMRDGIDYDSSEQ